MAHIIGLTGGIGVGKSVVSKIFSCVGISVFDTDIEAKKIIHTDTETQEKIKEQISSDCFIDGQLNKPYIRQLIFENPAMLSKMNSIVHPVVRKKILLWKDNLPASTPFAVIESAILFESNLNAICSQNIAVLATKELRIKWLSQNRNLSPKDIENIMSSQMNEEDKQKQCDYLIKNSEQGSVIEQTLAIYKRITALYT